MPGKPPIPGIPPMPGIPPPAIIFFMLRAIAAVFMPGIFPIMPRFWPRPPIIWRMKRNFCTSSFTASGLVPEPLEMRLTRPGSRTSAYGSFFSKRVIDEMIASMRTSSRSSRFTPSGSPPGNMPPRGSLSTRSFKEPIFWIIFT